jgi:hypothetical protein
MMRSAAHPGRALIGLLLASVALAPVCVSQAATPKPKNAQRPPLASTGGALDVSDSSAALGGTVNPRGLETSYYFQYGLTTAYGAQTPTVGAGSSTTGVKVSQPLSGLQLGTTYHYRVVAVSSAGATDGQDRTFTTKQIPLRFVITNTPGVNVFGSPFSIGGTLTGTGGANHQVILQANPFPYLGSFTDIGSPASTDAAGSFSFRVPSFSQSTELRVRTLDALPTYSQAVAVHVAVLVTFHARPTRNRGFVRLDGTVTPSEVGAPVIFQWVRSNRGPVKVGGVVVRRGTASFSRFSAVVSIRHGGLYRAVVKVTNGKQVSGASRTILLHAPPGPARKAHRVHTRRR